MKTPTPEELLEAFKSIQQHELQINAVICSECGCVFKFDNTEPCEHLVKMFEDWADLKGWDRF